MHSFTSILLYKNNKKHMPFLHLLATAITFLLPLLLLLEIKVVNGSGAETWDYQNVFQKNVIDGSKAEIDRYPYHATINIKTNKDLYNICGGTLIDKNWIVTAAHCAETNGYDMIVEIGRDSYRKSEDKKYEERDVEFTCIHPFFNPMNFQYDIALLYFGEESDVDPVTIDTSSVDLAAYSKRSTINGSNTDDSSTTSPLRVIGYGSTSIFGDGPYPKRLQEADVFYVNEEKCENVVRSTGAADMFTNWTMCASGFGEQDTCIGDSGGPLLIPGKEGDDDTLVGVVSIGPVPCMEDDTPVLYTRISKAYDWMMNVIEGDTDLCK